MELLWICKIFRPQPHFRNRAFSHGGAEGQLCPVGVCDLGTQGKPQSRAPFTAGAGSVRAVKGLGDAGKLFLCHPRAVVGDGKKNSPFLLAAGQGYPSVLLLPSGLHGVFRQVGK